MSVGKVYPLYVNKVERKGQTRGDLNKVIRWLTGFTQSELDQKVADEDRPRTRIRSLIHIR